MDYWNLSLRLSHSHQRYKCESGGDFVTVESVVTESSTGPRKRFREMIVAHVGVHGWVSPGSLLSGTRLSYGASAVARTSDRGHVAEEVKLGLTY